MCYYLRKARAERRQLKLKLKLTTTPPPNQSAVGLRSPSSPTTISTPPSAAFADLSRTAKADLPEESVRTIRLPVGSLAPLEESHYFRWAPGRGVGFIGKSMRKLQSTIKRAQEKKRRKEEGEEGGKVAIKSTAVVNKQTIPPTYSFSGYRHPKIPSKSSRRSSVTDDNESPSLSSDDDDDHHHQAPEEHLDSKTEEPLPSLRENPIVITTLTPSSSKAIAKLLSKPPPLFQNNVFAQAAASQAAASAAKTKNWNFDSSKSAATASRGLQQMAASMSINSVHNNNKNNRLVGEDSLRLEAMPAEIEPTVKSSLR